ncbi:hypothetical protein ACJMK2_015383 [Sinanodonta woodiana]|uniref:THO complex subunit 7 homolog n=1 Tax=Sinanodonta woodiana TaxID=1069815 RepID=A0ABD3UQ61_SINWO
MSVNDDEIIKKRLLIDGDGGNDDKRITNLLKTLIRWCHSSESDEESRLTCQRMLATLAQCEHTMEKSATVYHMNLKEQVNYDNLSREIEEKIQAAMEKINECKNELQQAKRIRKHRQEYDALAKVIQQHPDRQDTMKKLESLDKELAVLDGTKESLEHKLDMRRKQFHVLIAAIHELQSVIEEDEKTSEMDTV